MHQYAGSTNVSPKFLKLYLPSMCKKNYSEPRELVVRTWNGDTRKKSQRPLTNLKIGKQGTEQWSKGNVYPKYYVRQNVLEYKYIKYICIHFNI